MNRKNSIAVAKGQGARILVSPPGTSIAVR